MSKGQFLGETENLLAQFIDNVLALAHCAINKPAKSNRYDVKVQNSVKRATMYYDEGLMELYKETEKDIKSMNEKINDALRNQEVRGSND